MNLDVTSRRYKISQRFQSKNHPYGKKNEFKFEKIITAILFTQSFQILLLKALKH